MPNGRKRRSGSGTERRKRGGAAKSSIFNQTGSKALYYRGGLGEKIKGAFENAKERRTARQERRRDQKDIDLNIGGISGGQEPPEIPWNPPEYIMQAEKGSMDLKKINKDTGLDMMQTLDKYADAANTIKNMEFKEETGYDSPEAMEKELEEYNATPMQNRTLDKFKGKYDQ